MRPIKERLEQFIAGRWYRMVLVTGVAALCVVVTFTSNEAEFGYFVLGIVACAGVAVAVRLEKIEEKHS